MVVLMVTEEEGTLMVNQIWSEYFEGIPKTEQPGRHMHVTLDVHRL